MWCVNSGSPERYCVVECRAWRGQSSGTWALGPPRRRQQKPRQSARRRPLPGRVRPYLHEPCRSLIAGCSGRVALANLVEANAVLATESTQNQAASRSSCMRFRLFRGDLHAPIDRRSRFAMGGRSCCAIDHRSRQRTVCRSAEAAAGPHSPRCVVNGALDRRGGSSRWSVRQPVGRGAGPCACRQLVESVHQASVAPLVAVRAAVR